MTKINDGGAADMTAPTTETLAGLLAALNPTEGVEG